MATHSSVLAWRIPGTGEPGGLPSLGSHRVGHDWGDAAAGKTWSSQALGGASFTHTGSDSARGQPHGAGAPAAGGPCRLRVAQSAHRLCCSTGPCLPRRGTDTGLVRGPWRTHCWAEKRNILWAWKRGKYSSDQQSAVWNSLLLGEEMLLGPMLVLPRQRLKWLPFPAVTMFRPFHAGLAWLAIILLKIFAARLIRDIIFSFLVIFCPV